MYENLGRMLRQLRKDRGETLEQVAAATGLSIAMLSRLERGERLPSPDSIEALSAHFLIERDELLGETIANRIHSRYGERGTELAAERFRTPPRAEEPVRDASPPRARRSVAGFSAQGIEALGAAPSSPGEQRARMRPSAAPIASPSTESEFAWQLAQASVSQAARTYGREATQLSPAERMELVHAIDGVAHASDDLLRHIATTDDDAGVRAIAHKALSLRHSARR